MVTGIAHVCIWSKDLAATERFYCSGLGCKKAFEFIRGGKLFGFYLEVSARNYIEVFYREEIVTDPACAIRHMCLEVDDIDDTARRLQEHGYEVTEKKLGGDHSWQAWTTDPSGVKIECHQYTDESCQFTHENCVSD